MLGFIWILLGSSALGQINSKLTILHTNDVHSHYDITNKYGTDCTKKQIDNDECWGSSAILKQVINNQQKENKEILLLDGGDQFQGTLFYSYYNGSITAEIMNELGYNAMSLGNHEFDHGPQELAKALASIKFPIVAANVDASSVPELASLIKPYVEFPQYGVAVVGYLTPTAPTITTLGSVEVVDPITPVQNVINELRKKGYNRIIGLSHHGYHEDMDLASKTKGLSLIVGGHSHTYLKPNGAKDDISGKGLKFGGFYPTPVENLEKEITYVVQAGCWGRFLGHIDIEFKENGYISDIKGEPIELNLKLKAEPEMKEKVAKWRAPFDEYARKVLGSVSFDFVKSTCFDMECDLGNWLTDILIHHRPKPKIAVLNSAGIRAGLSAGNITVGDILMMLPFGESIVDIKLSGQEIWNFIQASVTQINPVNGKPVSSTVQVSGIRATYITNKLLTVELKDDENNLKPLDLNKVYFITTNEFMANGGDNIIYPVPSPSPTLQKIDELVINYIKSNPIINSPPSGPRLIHIPNTTYPSNHPYKCIKKTP